MQINPQSQIGKFLLQRCHAPSCCHDAAAAPLPRCCSPLLCSLSIHSATPHLGIRVVHGTQHRGTQAAGGLLQAGSTHPHAPARFCAFISEQLRCCSGVLTTVMPSRGPESRPGHVCDSSRRFATIARRRAIASRHHYPPSARRSVGRGQARRSLLKSPGTRTIARGGWTIQTTTH